MSKALLTAQLAIQPSQLYVGNLHTMKQFYSHDVGLDILGTTKETVLLGKDGTGILELISKPKLAFANPRDAGLFHNAILFSSRGDLSRTVGTALQAQPDLFSGTGDHLVSEAFYFNDPEGNGVELYFDRPTDSWQWSDGRVRMDTLYFDPIEYVYTHASDYGASDRKLGHVHLKVGNLLKARQFYVSLLGFSVTAEVPGALFVSVAGYHHHIGLNTWLSSGAGKRSATLGLSNVTITLETEADISALAQRLETAQYAFQLTKGILTVNDPWNNALTFTT